MTTSRSTPEQPDPNEPRRPTIGVVAVDAEGLVRHLDAAAETITGWTLPQARGRVVDEVVCLVDAEHKPLPSAKVRGLLMDSRLHTGYHMLASRSGEARNVELTCAPVVDRVGRLASVVLTLHDAEATDPVAMANHRLRMVVQSMPVMMDAFDENRLITVWNTECERVTGFSAEEVIGNPDALLLMYPDPEYRERMLKEWTERGSSYRNWAWEITCKDGTKRTIEWSNISGDLPIPGWTTWGVGVDVTERLRLEASVRQSQKMDAIGQLAGGVAHDFNNLLTVMNGCAEEIIAELDGSNTEILSLAEMIVDTAQRASLLTRQLLLFSRRAAPHIQLLDLNDIIRRCTQVLSRTLGEQVLLRVDLRENPPPGGIRGDASRVEQVLFNLCINARDAMPSGGPLVLSSDTATVTESDLAMWPEAKPGRYVVLTVADAGTGMSKEVKAHLFEPFFTTKAVGHGTGLGLATVFGIVQDMGGFIIVDSQPGVGTTMRVFLPESDKVGASRSAPKAEAKVGGSETILLVEDDASLRRLSARRLIGSGYRVLEAGSGNEALQCVEATDCVVDLLLTDLVMPGMSGLETANVLRANCPKLRVLFMSGYSPDAALRDGAGLAGELLQKPFTMSELLERVRRALDGAHASV